MVQLAGMPLSSSSSSPRSALNHTRSPRARPRHSSAASPQQLRARDAGTGQGPAAVSSPGPARVPAGRGAADRRGCTGTGIQECCFFHPGFRQVVNQRCKRVLFSPARCCACLP